MLAPLHPQRIDLSLERIERLLADARHPAGAHLPPVIHVAGTNGKGSTVAFLRAILEAAGKRVHVYTSPHLVRFNERIRSVAGRRRWSVDDELLAALDGMRTGQRRARRSLSSRSPPRRPAVFSRASRPTSLLLEVGLGGRLDATNVVERPLATVITPISIDHAEFLGDSARQDRGREGRHPQARACR